MRNMVCDRCKSAVARVLEDNGVAVKHMDLGDVDLEKEPSAAQLERIRAALEGQGFELVDGRDAATIARIKAVIVKLVHHGDAVTVRRKLSEHVGTVLEREYSGLSALFSQVEGITIEQYFLLQRVERVKELVKYNEFTLSEIADRTGFSSVAHLSAQFKKLTGMTPSAFKAMGQGRTPLDQVGRM